VFDSRWGKLTLKSLFSEVFSLASCSRKLRRPNLDTISFVPVEGHPDRYSVFDPITFDWQILNLSAVHLRYADDSFTMLEDKKRFLVVQRRAALLPNSHRRISAQFPQGQNMVQSKGSFR
jgi:hypothetical protein